MGSLTLSAPVGLALAGLLVPLVLLYVLKAKRTRVKVASTWLWESAARDVMARSPWKKLRGEASLLIEAAALISLTLAFARPVVRAAGGGAHAYALILDVSASMGAAARAGEPRPSRLDAAKVEAKRWLDGLAPGARVLLVEAGRDAHLASALDTDRRRLARAIDSLDTLEVEGDLDAGVALAADRLNDEPNAEIVVFTDGNLAHPPALDGVRLPVDVRTVGDRIDNVAIVSVAATTSLDRSTRADATEVLALVANFGASEREIYATLRRAEEPDSGAILASRRVLVAAGERTPVVLAFTPSPADIGQGLIVDVSPHDALPVDDVAFVRVPEGPRLTVLLATKGGRPSPWLERALSSDANIALTKVDAASLEGRRDLDGVGLIVVDGACFEGPAASDLLIVDPPEGSCRSAKVGAVVERPVVTSWSSTDPRLRFASLDGVSIERAREVRVADPKASLARAGERTLIADVSQGPRAATLVGFDVGETSWPLTASFVVFVRNVVEEARSDRARGAIAGARTGEPLRLAVPGGASRVTVTGPSGAPLEIAASAGLAIVPPLARSGLYRIAIDGQEGRTILPVNLASAAESDLSSRLVLPKRLGITSEVAAAARPALRELGYGFALGALLLMLADVWVVTRAFSARTRPVGSAFVALSTLCAGYEACVLAGWCSETYVRLERPWIALAMPVAVGFVASRFALRHGGAAVRARAVVVELAAGVLTCALVLAVAGPSVGRALRRLTLIVAVDRSRSIDLVPDAAQRVATELRRAETSMREGDRIGTVVFGASASTEERPRTREEGATAERVEVARDGTNLDLALRRALGDVPPDSAARIVLVSDGVANRGDTFSAAAASVAAEVPIDAVALEQRKAPDVRVVSVLGPARGDAGEAIDLRVVTQATQESPVTVRVLEDGSVISTTRMTLATGEDVLRLRQKLPVPGLHHYEVRVEPTDPALDAFGDDNSGDAFVRVRGASAALVLEGDPGKSAFVAAALRGAGFRVDEGGTDRVPLDLAGFARYDLVVLSDIAASRLAPAQIEALAGFARDFGGGLLLMGGDRSLGPGGYGKSAIEEISPVSFDLKQKERRAKLAEVIGIDISGSMAMRVGGRTKLELANEAAARSAALLSDADRLGVEHVDTEVHWSVPLGPIQDRAAIDRAIRGVQVGGGGIIVPITMEAGYAALDRETTNLRHMLLFADGDDAEEIKAAMPLTPQAHARGITTSTVALGPGKDVADLEEMARLGGGRFYLVEDAARLPAVFAEETVLASRSAISEEPFQAGRGAPSPATQGIDIAAAPALGGYVVTIPKPRATVSLVGPEGDPILATWQIGVGQCGVFTSDLKDRWGAAWTAWSPASRLVAQTARALERRADDDRVALEADASGGELHLRATVSFDDRSADSFRRLRAHVGGPDGLARDVDLDPIGAGAYAATVPLSRPGTYLVVARDAASGAALASTGAVLGAGEELRPTGTDWATLERIAKETGGKVRTSLERVFDDRPRARYAYEDVSRALFALAAALVVLLVASRRLSLPAPKLAAAVARWRSRPREEAAPRADVAPALGALLASKGASRARHRPEVRETPVKIAEAPPGVKKIAVAAPRVDRPPEPSVASSLERSTAELLAEKRRKRRDRSS